MPASVFPFEFVAVDPATKLKPGKSLQVRSRCMQGKNRRDGSKGRQRIRKTNEGDAHTTSMKRQTPETAHLPPPNTVLSDLALIEFATGTVSVTEEDRGLLFRAYSYNHARESLSPLERSVYFDCLESASFSWAFQDPAYLHSVLCSGYAMNDIISPSWNGKPGRKTLYHMRETLALLRAKMNHQDAHNDECVLMVVMNLALLSAVYGDWLAAGVHYKGLQKIVHLRGSLDFLKSRPALHFKLDRIDLAYSLSSGKKPFFLHPSVAWDPIIPVPYLPLPHDLYRPLPEWDYGLANVFQDLQYLSLRINRNRLKRAHHDPACFQAVLTSIQSRLTHLADIVESPIEELIRLTMLAFMTTTFRAPGQTLPFGWIIERLRDVYKQAVDGALQYDLTLRLWVLVTVSFPLRAARQTWLQDAWRETGVGLGWQVVKPHLMQVMWIELIHDEPGERLLQDLEELMS